MNMNIETKGSIVVAQVEDTQIGADSADEFKARILEQLPTEKGQIAVNLAKVDFMDSSGLGALVSLLKAVRPEGELVLYGMKASVKEILRLTHLDAVFQCESNEEGAMATLEKGA